MKPQCNTSAECLRELARVMEQFGITYPGAAVKSKYVKVQGNPWVSDSFPSFDQPQLWQFAIAEVEGKPVFIGDELWCKDGEKHTIVSKATNFESLQWRDAMEGLLGNPIEYWSWNKPKPRTINIEMTVPIEDAEKWARFLDKPCVCSQAEYTLWEACKLALEKLK